MPVNDQIVFDITWSWKYGELPRGSYRLVMNISERGENGIIGTQEYHVPFIVTDDNDPGNLPYYDIPDTTEHRVVTLPVTRDKGTAKMIKAVGDNGITGYIYENDMINDGVVNPSDAVEKMQAIKDGTYVPRKINVYAEDGVTVIDTITEQIP